jgi:hypothetical protein
MVQWSPLNGITLGQAITDPFNQMIPITKHMSYKRMLLRGIQDLINLSDFDPIIRMIPLTVILLSGAHCIVKLQSEHWYLLGNGYSRANFANSSTRPKIAVFGEYSHSPKQPFSEICETRQTCRHLPSRVGRTCWHLPNHFARTRRTRRHLPNHFARTRQTRRHLPKAIFEKNVTRLTKICASNERVPQIWREWPFLSYLSFTKTKLLMLKCVWNLWIQDFKCNLDLLNFWQDYRITERRVNIYWIAFDDFWWVGVNCSKFDCSTVICSTLLAGNQLLDTKFINCLNPVKLG